MATGSQILSSHYHEVAVDPWDGDYCSETPIYLSQQTADQVEWFRPYDVSGGWLVSSIELTDAYGTYAVTAANRALSAAQAGREDCFWPRRYEALAGMRWMGNNIWYFRWALQVTADSFQGEVDPQILWDYAYAHLDGLADIASWSEGLQ